MEMKGPASRDPSGTKASFRNLECRHSPLATPFTYIFGWSIHFSDKFFFFLNSHSRHSHPVPSSPFSVHQFNLQTRFFFLILGGHWHPVPTFQGSSFASFFKPCFSSFSELRFTSSAINSNVTICKSVWFARFSKSLASPFRSSVAIRMHNFQSGQSNFCLLVRFSDTFFFGAQCGHLQRFFGLSVVSHSHSNVLTPIHLQTRIFQNSHCRHSHPVPAFPIKWIFRSGFIFRFSVSRFPSSAIIFNVAICIQFQSIRLTFRRGFRNAWRCHSHPISVYLVRFWGKVFEVFCVTARINFDKIFLNSQCGHLHPAPVFVASPFAFHFWNIVQCFGQGWLYLKLLCPKTNKHSPGQPILKWWQHDLPFLL